MIIARNETEIAEAIQIAKSKLTDAKIGFVPTMGALHQGHISLIELAKSQSDIVICSIFVNPTQFNNPTDLATYPRTVEEDTALLAENGCDILLLPTVEAVYPNGILPYSIDLEGLDKGMEGQFRPGHFEGVCMVVERFLRMVKPHQAFFGKKDFQQLAIIKKMATIRELPVEIIGAPIKRSAEGLALSSRNALLSPKELNEAPRIFNALQSGLEFSRKDPNAQAVKAHIIRQFENTSLTVEYVEIVDNDTLIPQETVTANSTVCIVAYLGEVRLIDNMQFADEINPKLYSA